MEVGGRGVQGCKVGGRSQRAGNLRNRYADQGRLRDSVMLRDQIIFFELLIHFSLLVLVDMFIYLRFINMVF